MEFRIEKIDTTVIIYAVHGYLLECGVTGDHSKIAMNMANAVVDGMNEACYRARSDGPSQTGRILSEMFRVIGEVFERYYDGSLPASEIYGATKTAVTGE